MLPLQILFLNLIYDVSCISLPWDQMDKEYLTEPKKWKASSIGKFMVYFGPTSSIFDITTYLLMYFVICPAVVGETSTHWMRNNKSYLLHCSMPDGLSNPCGHKRWYCTHYVHRRFHFYKVTQHLRCSSLPLWE